MADRVLSLTTLGTPHGGTSIADFGVSLLAGLLNIIDSTRLADLHGFFDLTRRHRREFEQEGVADAESVPYFSVAGLYQPGFVSLDLLKPTHDFISLSEGENDGLVSVTSATFGAFLGTWPGNHFRLINWPTNLLEPVEELVDDSVVSRYLGLVQFLAEEMS